MLLRQQLEEEEDSLGLNLDGKEEGEEENEEEEEEDRPRQKYEAGSDNRKKRPLSWWLELGDTSELYMIS